MKHYHHERNHQALGNELIEPDVELSNTGPVSVVNVIASILTQIAIPAFQKYHNRMFVLDEQIRLVRLKQDIGKQQLPVEAIPEYIAAASEDLKNPFTLEPMTWNAENRTLSFVRPGKEEQFHG